MKKILVLLFLLITGLRSFAQDVPPPGAAAVSPAFTWYKKVTGVDTAYYGYSKGNWVNFAGRNWMNNLFLKKADSTQYVTPYHFSQHASASQTAAAEGLSKTGDTIRLGGILTQPVRLDNTQATFYISADRSYYGALQALFYNDGITFSISQSSDHTYGTSTFSMYNYGGAFLVGGVGITLDPVYGFLVNNITHLNGMQYSEKQSFISDRSIPDKAWIDSAVNAHASGGGPAPTIACKTKATYAAMLADGTPAIATFYEITADENKNYIRSTYLWKPNGNREWIASTPDN